MSGCLGGGKECILIAKRQKRAFNSDRNVLNLDHSKGWKIVNLGKCIELYCLNGWILHYVNSQYSCEKKALRPLHKGLYKWVLRNYLIKFISHSKLKRRF